MGARQCALVILKGTILINAARDAGQSSSAFSLGVTLTGLSPCFVNALNGRILHADGIFFGDDD
jgi:hypothetical protein